MKYSWWRSVVIIVFGWLLVAVNLFADFKQHSPLSLAAALVCAATGMGTAYFRGRIDEMNS